MAELNVQPKKSRSVLPWILLLLVLAAVVWFLLRDKQSENANRTTAPDTAVNNEPNRGRILACGG